MEFHGPQIWTLLDAETGFIAVGVLAVREFKCDMSNEIKRKPEMNLIAVACWPIWLFLLKIKTSSND